MAKRSSMRKKSAVRRGSARAGRRPSGTRRVVRKSTGPRTVRKTAPKTPKSARLLDLARVIRSKNAGPFELTFDIMFDDPKAYEKVKRSGVITSKLVARLYRISHNEVLVCRHYDPAYAFKITIRRPIGSGDLGESDVYGCQQHIPLIGIEIPLGKAA